LIPPASPCSPPGRAHVALAIVLLFHLGVPVLFRSDVAWAERLPASLYTVDHGLAHNNVHQVLVDSAGFVWFATTSGVSRFDGQRFVSYGREHGLPDLVINSVIEDRHGRIWIATNGGGVARFDPAGPITATGERRAFTPYPVGSEADSNRVNRLFEARNGDLWATTDAGLYRRTPGPADAPFRQVPLAGPDRSERLVRVFAITEDALGLWLGSTTGVLRRLDSGTIVRYAGMGRATGSTVHALLVDRQGLVWIGSSAGLTVYRPDGPSFAPGGAATMTVASRPCAQGDAPTVRLPDRAGTACTFSVAPGTVDVRSLYESSDGRILIGTLASGVSEFEGTRLRRIAAGDDEFSVQWMAEDGTGNLWLCGRRGVLRVTRRGLALFRSADGLPPGPFVAMGEDPQGTLYVQSVGPHLHWFDGERFHAVSFKLPAGTARSSWPELRHLLDRNGEWWVGTGDGLFRFPRAASLSRIPQLTPIAVYTTKDGLPDDDIVQLFEDSRGDVWVATGLGSENGLSRWDRRTNRFQVFSEADGVSPFNQPLQFAEDRAGGVWVGFRERGLARYHDGRFTTFWRDTPGHRLYLDRSGSLWVTDFRRGTARIDDPESADPTVTWYSRAAGLSSDHAIAFAEDAIGHLYLGTDRAIDRLARVSGHIRHLTSDTGLPSGGATIAYGDRHGHVWFGSFEGLTRLTTGEETASAPPQTRIRSVRIAGRPHPVSEDGEVSLERVTLPAGSTAIEIDVFALGSRIGDTYRYQYQLVGADAEWGPLTQQRTVHYARLAPGRYRFQARAVNAAGLVSDAPASLGLEILPPFWMRWWFVALGAGAVSAATYGAYRYRLRQMLRVERVRARIATDLHDDIGASLSQIAILSEVARQRSDDFASTSHRLSQIADTSRGLVDAMSDIVWAIDPQRDSLADLTHRMRRFAADTLESRDIRFTFDAPDGHQHVRLGADLRREVFLILKESVTNIVRHSACTAASIAFSVDAHMLRLRIEDDGRGFALDAPVEGNGLRSMRRRVTALGGQLAIDSAPGRGTVVRLELRLKGRTGLA
jgi:signal transduction histidine kinase/ligand-binding sensor domain-containing protein